MKAVAAWWGCLPKIDVTGYNGYRIQDYKVILLLVANRKKRNYISQYRDLSILF